MWYIYCMVIVKKIWRFFLPGKIIFSEPNARGKCDFPGGINPYTCIPITNSLSCNKLFIIPNRSQVNFLDYIRFASFFYFNSHKAKTLWMFTDFFLCKFSDIENIQNVEYNSIKLIYFCLLIIWIILYPHSWDFSYAFNENSRGFQRGGV